MSTLTSDQLLILNQIKELIYDSNRTHSACLLNGSAGTGKTTLISTLLSKLPDYRLVYATAPTNKAVSVIRSKTHFHSSRTTFSTIHSLLSLKQSIDPKTGDISFKPTKPFSNLLPSNSILIIDEASMISSDLLSYLQTLISYNPTIFIIYVGDNKQLPPVGETSSPVFSLSIPTFTLTTILRHQNPIISLSQDLSLISSSIPNTTDQGGYIFAYPKDLSTIINTLIQKPNSRYLAYTNRIVDFVNNSVRKAKYNTLTPNKLYLGETLIFSEPYESNNFLYHTSDEITCNTLSITSSNLTFINNSKSKDKDITHITHEDIHNLHTITSYYFSINLKYYLINNHIILLHEDDQATYDLLLSKLKKKCLSKSLTNKLYWKDYYQNRTQVAYLSYSYAITAHKSQGSTYDTTIIDLHDITSYLKDNEKQKLLYTAITRASRLVVLHNFKIH